MKKLNKVLIIVVALMTVFAMTSCDAILDKLPFEIPFLESMLGGADETPDETPDDTPDEGDGNEDDGASALEGLVLVENNKAKFNIVYNPEIGSANINKLTELVQRLRALGVEVEDPAVYTNKAPTGCEIIVGTGIDNRGEDCNVSSYYLGLKGYVIKVVDNNVVVAGGSVDSLSSALDVFVKRTLGITDKLKNLDKGLAIPYETFTEKLTTYFITSVKVGGKSVENFGIVYDLEGIADYDTGVIQKFQLDFFNQTGLFLPIRESEEEGENNIVIRYSESIAKDTDNLGFIVYVQDGNLYIECSYANSFEKAFAKYVKEEIYDAMGDLSFSNNYVYAKQRVSEVCYNDFGAAGDGRTDDFAALLATHQYANQCGQKVVANPTSTYYIADIPENIWIKTNVDHKGAKFIINDVGDNAHQNRSNFLFYFGTYDDECVWIGHDDIKREFGNGNEVTLKAGDTSIPWLAGKIENVSFIKVYNSTHKDFIRWGANVNSGSSRHEVLVINPDGTLHPDTEVVWDYDLVDSIYIANADIEPLTFENGIYKSICCQAVAATGFINVYKSYNRGIGIYRCNVTVKNVDHEMQDEPLLDYESKKYGNSNSYGDRDESYPYGGFIMVGNCYNTLVLDSILDGHTTYYEDKTTSPNPVAMGSYDFTFSDATHITFRNIEQYNETGLDDQKYWGIMGSNFVKNLVYDNCNVSRFDAHAGFWNGKIINSTIGAYINAIGGGDLLIENVVRVGGGSSGFIDMRQDYGSTFNGNITIKDCTYLALNYHNSAKGQTQSKTSRDQVYIITSGWNSDQIYEWNFGYTCYMPRTLIIDNFKCNATSYFIYNDISNMAFDNNFDVPNYQITEKIIMRNMFSPIDMCPSTGCTILRSIPVVIE